MTGRKGGSGPTGSLAYDAIVVGAGHNGMVAAGYLARAGLRVVVVEGRERVGGLCATGEIVPGYRGNLGTNNAHSLDAKIVQDMRLTQFGLRFAHPEPSSAMLFPDDRVFVSWRNAARRREEMDKFALPGDVDGFADVMQVVEDVAESIGVSVLEPPPSLSAVAERCSTPAERDALHAVRVTSNFKGPYSPGTAYGLLARPIYNLSMRRAGIDVDHNRMGMQRQMPLGGMGAITEAMGRSIQADGATIRLGSPVEEILCDEGAVCGVRTRDQVEYRARIVVSAANPRMTLTELVRPEALDPEFVEQARAVDMRGCSFKVSLAMDGVPRFAAARSDEENAMLLQCGFRIAPSMKMMEQAYQDARAGRWSAEPMLWGQIPTSVDPSMAPEGGHTMSLSVFQAPYELAEGSWDQERDRFGMRVIDTLADYIPNIREIIVGQLFTSPVDFERDFGLTEGNATHGDVVSEQMFGNRPIPGCSDQRTPIRGLYLGSVGTWPGGFLSGLPGLNASRRVLDDLAQADTQTLEASTSASP
ncbi:phytoene desaturase family protein [Rhodococcus koreensis]|uniref:phytoene desaturase family protein n=1 Tax=Rhodococcus koreensis TaxID=99653 RepID=UPI00366EBEC4